MEYPRKSSWMSFKPLPLFALLAALAVSGFSQSRGKVAQPQNLGPEDQSKQITVTVWLNQHNKAAFDHLVHQMYQPGSPTYHHFLTQQEYRAAFAPSAADAAKVKQYLAEHNLTVTSADKFNHYIVAQGRVSDAQNAFNVQLNRVNLNGQIHRVSSAKASVAGEVGKLIHSVQGLSDFAPKPTLVRATDPATGKAAPGIPLAKFAATTPAPNVCLTGTQQITLPNGGSGPSAVYQGNRYATDATNTCPGYNPQQLQTAYGLNSLYNKKLDGAGQTIVIVDAFGSPTIQQDANAFSAYYGLPALTSTNFQIYYPGGIPVNCNPNCPGGDWAVETTLDVEMAHSIAPGANIALVIAVDNSSLDIANFWAIENPEILTSYANGDLGYTMSNSWASFEYLDAYYGGVSQLDTEYTMTELAAALGISDNFSSGDDGDYVEAIYNDYGIVAPPSVSTPASEPFATGVGGTSLFLNKNSNIQYQTGWGNNETRLSYASPNPPYDPPLHLGFVYGSGGGASAAWLKPPYQSALAGTTRQVPDVAYLADPYTGVNIIITNNGIPEVEVIGGTSLACPMFSGLWAIANQAAGAKAPLGQAAPLLYSLPTSAFYDVKPVTNGYDVRGTIYNPPMAALFESAAALAQPLENTTTFLSAIYHGSSTRYYDLTFGTDSSLVTAPGWDNVTGLGTPNGLSFIEAVVAAAP